jgi:hemerythrin
VLEEKYMSRFNYPGNIAHQYEHKAFTQKVLDFQKNFN